MAIEIDEKEAQRLEVKGYPRITNSDGQDFILVEDQTLLISKRTTQFQKDEQALNDNNPENI